MDKRRKAKGCFSKKRIRCIAVDVLLGVALVLLLLAESLPDLAHRFSGILFTVLVVVHLFQHRSWFKALRRGRWNTKRKVSAVMNLSVGFAVLVIVIVGFTVPGAVSLYVQMGGLTGIAQVHHVFGYVVAALIVMHTVYNARK